MGMVKLNVQSSSFSVRSISIAFSFSLSSFPPSGRYVERSGSITAL